MKKGLVFTALIAAFGIGLAACGNTPAAPKEYVVTIANKAALTEEWKDTPEDFRTATVTIKGKNNDEVVDFYEAVDAGDLKFTSSETSVLTVAGYGIITCQGAGKSTITATYKDKFSDSVEITVSQEDALRPAFTLDLSKSYWLGLVDSTGTKQFAKTSMSSNFYIGTDSDITKAATATVTQEANTTGDYKYVITLTSYKADGSKDKEFVLGTAFNENEKGKHYNIGFVGNKVYQSDLPYVKALWKFNEEDHTLHTMVAESAEITTDCRLGTAGTYKTLQLGPSDKIDLPAYLYEEGTPIHPETVQIKLGEGETEVTLRPGFSRKLEVVCTPDFVTDAPKWSSDNLANVTVDSTGLVSAVGASGTSANITVKVYRKSATVKVNVQGDGLQYGTAEAPLTIAQAKAQLDDLGDNGVTVFKMYVRGEISEVGAYDATYGNRNVWLKDGETAKAFELYRLKDGETPAEVKTEDLLVGQTITAVGYATKYVGSSTTYEFTPSQGFNPQPVKVEVPELTDISVSEKITVAINKTAEVSVEALPQGAILPEVTLAWKDTTQDVAEIVDGKIKGLKVGNTTLVVSAGAISKEVPVEVKETMAETAELKYTGTSNTTAQANCTEQLNLDKTIFTATYDKNGASSDMALRTDGIRMYATKQTTNGNKFTVTVASGYTIKSINIQFDSGYSATAEVFAGATLVTGTDGVYAINASSFTVFNNNSSVSSNTQVRFQKITITYAPVE